MKLKAQPRVKKEKLDNKTIPAVVYGSSIESKSIKLDKVEFEKIYEEAGESSLIDLAIDDEKIVKVIVKEVQKHPFKNLIYNVDLHQVDMSQKITTEIPLEFIGESKAKKEEGALIMQNLDAVEVECLPADLVNNIEVDLSSLNEFGDSIHVKDLKVPSGMEILEEPEEVVVSAIEPKEEEEEPIEGEAEVPEEGEGEEEGKKDDENKEAGAEGKEDKE
ncbi:MAG TPA: 50S ribosomal protein L25 [Patescibacteria group bacterium]|nr:50S ribosomal protein L25 [Patescibacteria group bacterium]